MPRDVKEQSLSCRCSMVTLGQDVAPDSLPSQSYNMTVFFNKFCGTLPVLYMLYFVCVFIYLLPYRCNGHATIFELN